MSIFSHDLIQNEEDIERLKIMKKILDLANKIKAKDENHHASYIVTGMPVIKDLEKTFVLHPEL